VAEAAKKKYPDDEEQQKEFKKLNPFTAPADSVCQFKATATKGRKTTEWVLSDTSNLTHSTFCPVSGGRVKASLLTSSASFAASVSAAGGKANKKVLAAEAAKAGLGGVAADSELLWRAQRALRKQANAAWDAQWAELPRYLERLRERGAKVALDYDDEGTFLRAFVAFTSVYDALKIAGRPVCSTDFGHMKHDFFQGLNATGVFQFGDGVAVPLWAAIFADTDESAFHWEWCAKQIKAAGMSDIYVNIAHFRDRHVGAERFEFILNIEFGLCVRPLPHGPHPSAAARLTATEQESRQECKAASSCTLAHARAVARFPSPTDPGTPSQVLHRAHYSQRAIHQDLREGLSRQHDLEGAGIRVRGGVRGQPRQVQGQVPRRL